MRARWPLPLGVLALAGCTLIAPYPGVSGEICGNRVDDDLDGDVDCDDTECNGVEPCTSHVAWLETGEPPVERPAMACPTGWRVVSGADGIATCDPYPETGPATCDPGFAHFPGDADCGPIGRRCPSGDWPEDLPSSNVIYVRSGATGGTGSRDEPVGTLTLALNMAYGSHATIALARGTYEASGETLQSVTIRGACAAQTVIRSATTLGHGYALFAVPSATAVVLEDVHIDGGSVATGLVVSGDLTLRGVWLTNLVHFGLIVRGADRPAYLDAHELVLQHIAFDVDAGYGIIADSGADVRLGRVIVEDTATVGILMSGHVGSLEIADAVVRDVHAGAATAQDGVGIQTDVPTTMNAVLVERSRAFGLVLFGRASVSDLLVRDVASPGNAPGAGVLAGSVDSQTVRRATIERAPELGVWVRGPGSAAFEDLVVRDTLRRPLDGHFGRGVHTDNNGTVRMQRAWIEASEEMGVFATQGGHMQLVDVTVHGSRGVGIAADHASTLDLTRVIVDASVGAGILALGRGTTLTSENVLVRATAPAPDGTLGYGIAVQDHAFALGDHVLVDTSGSVGVMVQGERATFLLTDAVVRGTQAPACGPACGGGAGIGVYDGSDVALHRFVVDGASACGLDLSESTAAELVNGAIGGAPAGVCASAARMDLPTIQEGFAYTGEGDAVVTHARTVPVSVPVIAE